jgi:hypothetical protein
MRKIIATLIVSAGLLAPAFAFADTFGIQPTLGQLLSRIAAIEAMSSGNGIYCEVAATKSTVKAGEPFTIAWGSYGADAQYSTDPKNVYPQNGEQAMQIGSPQIHTYKFTFFGPNGLSTTCSQTITVIR